MEAQKAFLKGDYNEASLQYQLLAKQSFFTPSEVTLNYAHSLFELKDTLAARKKYAQLVSLKEPNLASTTYSQLGIIFCYEKDTVRALALFKEALILKPDNEIARYNYELLKKQYHAKKNQQESKSQTNNKQPSPPPSQQQQNAEVANDNSQKELLKTLKNYGLTLEKAKTILDGMKNDEIQYIQKRNNLVKSRESRITQNW
jgi:tetratricopeptide (TPR) repeat protein